MPSPYLYYTNPFGVSADDLPDVIPMDAAVDGSVSYFAGWTPPYELNLLTDPTALPIPRGQMNQLFYDITNNLQEYQQYGTPQWVTGNTVSYPIYARVYYSGVVYESQIGSNTNTPGTDTTWRVISGSIDGVPIGVMLDFAGIVPPTNYLLCDGSAVNRSTYAALLSTLSQTQTGSVTVSMPTVTGLTNATTTMYGTFGIVAGMAIESTNFAPGTTVLSVTNATTVIMSTNALTGVAAPITFFNWGNGDGSTTFNLPDFRRRVAMGSGGTASSDPLGIGNILGETGGEESHSQVADEVGPHVHGGSIPAGTTLSSGGLVIVGSNSTTPVTITTGTNSPNGAPANVIQPSNAVTKIIKYI